MRPPNFYAGLALERFAERRRDAAFIETRLAAAAARFVPVWRARSLVVQHERPRALFLEAPHAGRLARDLNDSVFLGDGDGNVHYNVSQPPGMDKAAFLALWEPMQDAVHSIVADMGGSISAEHGIGRMKRGELRRTKSSVELELMTRLKAAFDPLGILNPGKLL